MPRIRRRGTVVLVSGLLVLTTSACGSSEPVEPPSPPTVTALPTDVPSETPTPQDPAPVDPVTSAPAPDAPDAPATDEPPSAPPAGPGVSTVTVTTSYWGYDAELGTAFANGYADVVDLGGRCTLTLTQGSLTASASADVTPDARTTSCGEITIPGAELSSGTWQAVIAYTSPSSSGQSAPVEIVVP